MHLVVIRPARDHTDDPAFPVFRGKAEILIVQLHIILEAVPGKPLVKEFTDLLRLLFDPFDQGIRHMFRSLLPSSLTG